MLKMLRGIGNSDAAAFSQRFNRSFALGDEFQQFKPVLMAKRLGNSCELRIERALGVRA
jgi:hypothetical protein